MAEEKDSKKSFWTTIPGILTGIAALITAVGGFLVAIDSSRLVQWAIEGDDGKTPASEWSKMAEEQEPEASAQNTTSGGCSPVVDKTIGDVSITLNCKVGD